MWFLPELHQRENVSRVWIINPLCVLKAAANKWLNEAFNIQRPRAQRGNSLFRLFVEGTRVLLTFWLAFALDFCGGCFNNKDNNSHDPTLRHQYLVTERVVAAEITYRAVETKRWRHLDEGESPVFNHVITLWLFDSNNTSCGSLSFPSAETQLSLHNTSALRLSHELGGRAEGGLFNGPLTFVSPF